MKRPKASLRVVSDRPDPSTLPCYLLTYQLLTAQVRKHQPDGRFMACVYGRDGELDEEWLEYYGEAGHAVEWRLVARLGCTSPPAADADAATAPPVASPPVAPPLTAPAPFTTPVGDECPPPPGGEGKEGAGEGGVRVSRGLRVGARVRYI